MWKAYYRSNALPDPDSDSDSDSDSDPDLIKLSHLKSVVILYALHKDVDPHKKKVIDELVKNSLVPVDTTVSKVAPDSVYYVKEYTDNFLRTKVYDHVDNFIEELRRQTKTSSSQGTTP